MTANAFINVGDPGLVGIGKQFSSKPVPVVFTNIWNGAYAMSGFTKDSLGAPYGRRVYLYQYPGANCLGAQDSDPITGAFTWDHLRRLPLGRYFMVALDKTGTFNGGVHDNVVPV